MNLKNLEETLQYQFKDINLLTQAVSHSSFTKKRKDSYERLEFFGDRILSFVIAQKLYEMYPDELEGDLSKRHSELVSKNSLLEIANFLELPNYIKTQNRVVNNTCSIASDSVEAIIASIYLESGFNIVQSVIVRLWSGLFAQMNDFPPQDFKSKLQEWLQKKYNELPIYSLISKDGPDHQPIFKVKVSVNNGLHSYGEGESLKIAEKEAAKIMLEKIYE